MSRNQKTLVENALAAINKANQPLHAQDHVMRGVVQDEAMRRLDKLKDLTSETGNKDGYHFAPAITAYKLSLQAYIAIHYDRLSQQEITALQAASQSLMNDVPSDATPGQVKAALGTGLKGEANWTDLYRTQVLSEMPQQAKAAVPQYTQDLLNGASRPVIDKTSPVTDLQRTSVNPDEVTRVIPAFFPTHPNAPSGTNEIILQTGGCSGHSAMVRIWKQGVDKDGHPVAHGVVPHHYRFFRTMCNAGLGCSSFPSGNELYHLGGLWGDAYSVETREISPPPGYANNPVQQYNAMREILVTLINAERNLLAYKAPTPGPNGELAEPATKAQWDTLNNSVRLGPVVPEKSVKTMPQTTGNCTVRSILEFLRFELIQQGLTPKQAGKILSSHWEFAAQNNTDATLAALAAAKARAEQQTLPKQVGANESVCTITAIKKLAGTFYVITVQTNPADPSASMDFMYDTATQKGFLYDKVTTGFSESVADLKFQAVLNAMPSINMSCATPRADIAVADWLEARWTTTNIAGNTRENTGKVSAMTPLSNGLFAISGYLFNGGVKGDEREVIYDPVTRQAWWYGSGRFNPVDLSPPPKTMAACMVEKFAELAPAYNVRIPTDQDLFADITNKNFDQMEAFINSSQKNSSPQVPMPQIAVCENGQNHNLPATDHPVVVTETALGKMGTLNVWCPNSPVSPPIAKALGIDKFKLENERSHEIQMKAIARYIVDCFKSGVTLLALQEIPRPETDAFIILERELREIAAREGVKINIDDLKKYYQPTSGTQSGTSILVNPEVFTIQNNISALAYNNGFRGAIFTIHPTAHADKQFQVLNFHGTLEGTQGNLCMPDAHVKELQKKIDSGAICLGDSNMQRTEQWFENNNNSTVSASASTVTVNGKTINGNTLDVVIVPPNFLQSKPQAQFQLGGGNQQSAQLETKKLQPPITMAWQDNGSHTGTVNTITKLSHDEYKISGTLSGPNGKAREITYNLQSGTATFQLSPTAAAQSVTGGMGKAMQEMAPLLIAKAGFPVASQKLRAICVNVLKNTQKTKAEMKSMIEETANLIVKSTVNNVDEKINALKAVFDAMKDETIALRKEEGFMLGFFHKPQSYQDALITVKNAVLQVLGAQNKVASNTINVAREILQEQGERISGGNVASLRDERFTKHQPQQNGSQVKP